MKFKTKKHPYEETSSRSPYKERIQARAPRTEERQSEYGESHNLQVKITEVVACAVAPENNPLLEDDAEITHQKEADPQPENPTTPIKDPNQAERPTEPEATLVAPTNENRKPAEEQLQIEGFTLRGSREQGTHTL